MHGVVNALPYTGEIRCYVSTEEVEGCSVVVFRITHKDKPVLGDAEELSEFPSHCLVVLPGVNDLAWMIPQ